MYWEVDILKKNMEINTWWFCKWKQKVTKTYANVWDGIKNEIKAINGGKENHYGKDYMKIKFNSDDDLPWNKPLKVHAMTIIIRSVFEEGVKLYP